MSRCLISNYVNVFCYFKILNSVGLNANSAEGDITKCSYQQYLKCTSFLIDGVRVAQSVSWLRYGQDGPRFEFLCQFHCCYMHNSCKCTVLTLCKKLSVGIFVTWLWETGKTSELHEFPCFFSLQQIISTSFLISRYPCLLFCIISHVP
jgi:hypothetical protein